MNGLSVVKLKRFPTRWTALLEAVVGPHAGSAWVLYSIYGVKKRGCSLLRKNEIFSKFWPHNFCSELLGFGKLPPAFSQNGPVTSDGLQG